MLIVGASDGKAPLVAPQTPIIAGDSSDDNRSTVLLQPSASFLQSLRRERTRPRRRLWRWALIMIGLAGAIVALALFLIR